MSGLANVRLHLVESIADVRNFDAWFLSGPQQHGVMAVDTETTGLVPGRDTVRLVQVGDGTDGWALPWTGWSGAFEDVMDRFNGTVLMHNAPFDQPMLRSMGHTIPWHRIQDTRPMAHILDPSMRTGLKPLASRLVDPAAGAAQKELEQAIKQLGWAGVPVKFGPYWQYGALDPVLTYLCWQKMLPLVPQYAYEVENGVLSVLATMMDNRVPVNVEYAKEQYDKFMSYAEQVADWCQRSYGVNPGSNQQVVRVLQEQTDYVFTKGTAAGAVALDREVLESIDHPLAVQVLKRRKIQKLATTYLDHFVSQSEDGYIRASLNSLGARTGRMSVSSPNMQNLPRVSEGDRAASTVRNCVQARAGHTLVFCDFAQVETRLLAHLSQDPGLLAAFHAPDDFFVTLARQVFNDPTITKKSPKRNVIKTWVYATIYGAGVEKQAKSAGLPVAEMAAIAASINATFPGIKRFQNQVAADAARAERETGSAHVFCPLSGRRHVADPGKAYALVNHLIQGMAAFFFKMKLLELDAAGLGEYMIIPVHDEIILHVPNDRVPHVCQVLTDVMNDHKTFTVPIEAEVSTGPRWGEKTVWTLAA